MIYVHLIQFLTWGGVGSVVLDISKSMIQQNARCIIISLFESPNTCVREEVKRWCDENEILLIELNTCGKFKSVAVFNNLRKKLKDIASQDEVTLFMHLKWGVLAGIISSLRLKNIYKVEVYHSNYSNYKLQSRVMGPAINKYIAVSKGAKKELIEKFRVPTNKVKHIYNGVDIDYINRIIIDIQKEVSDKYILCSVGRLSHEKGFLTACIAMNEVVQKNNLIEYKLLGDGPQMDDCKKYMISDNLQMLGHVSREKVYCEIEKSDIIILPSLFEGNSILLLEVLAIGKPVIITDIEAYREVFDIPKLSDDMDFRIFEYGIQVRKNDVNSLKKGVLEICMNKDRLKKMATASRALGLNFSIEKQAKSYMNIQKGE